MAMLDGIRTVFLEALSFAAERSRAALVEQWNKECQAVYEYKKQLIAEERYKAAHNKTEWISVEERLPECDTNVLVITVSGSFKIARVNIYKNGTVVLWATNDGLGERAITHWMPLPEPPEKREPDCRDCRYFVGCECFSGTPCCDLSKAENRKDEKDG